MFFLILGNTVNIFVQHRHLSNDMRKVYILEPFIFSLFSSTNWEAIQVTGREVIKSDLTIVYQIILVI